MLRGTDIEHIYDIITPYGYGGVLFEGNICVENLQSFWSDFTSKMVELNIVDCFVRYHPILANALPMKQITDVIDLGKTVALDLTSPEVIWENIVSKNRNMIRKAEKNGVEIKHSNNPDLFEDFIRIYNATMDKDNAVVIIMKFFRKILSYHFLELPLKLYKNATFEDKIIAMSIILFANKQMHYHLSGSVMEYRNLAPSNLLLYKAALWGCEHGYKTFHLGGGVGSGEDNLYKFKAAFNKNSNYQFSIAKYIFNQDKYDELVNIRKEHDDEFNLESHFFPIYRS
ncbi:peptidoglycan bridge formation glycyltransferase FemA/FemB family protein [Bacteroides fragilis]|uniref:peptidoglycan bridge formation glycyltransferase FemA/FemB family protein n=1 Tax=Bacteroides fragilis TaxID=817 RepID=UPI0037041552